jgi:hypothetical protein
LTTARASIVGSLGLRSIGIDRDTSNCRPAGGALSGISGAAGMTPSRNSGFSRTRNDPSVHDDTRASAASSGMPLTCALSAWPLENDTTAFDPGRSRSMSQVSRYSLTQAHSCDALVMASEPSISFCPVSSPDKLGMLCTARKFPLFHSAIRCVSPPSISMGSPPTKVTSALLVPSRSSSLPEKRSDWQAAYSDWMSVSSSEPDQMNPSDPMSEVFESKR